MHLEKKIDHPTKMPHIWLLFRQLNAINNLAQNYRIIPEKLIENCSHIKSFSQFRQPKLSNIELVALNLTAERISYNSDFKLFGINKDANFENKIERSVYKLQPVCDENAAIHSFDFTSANIHGVNYLKDIKYNKENCELTGGRASISAHYDSNP